MICPECDGFGSQDDGQATCLGCQGRGRIGESVIHRCYVCQRTERPCNCGRKINRNTVGEWWRFQAYMLSIGELAEPDFDPSFPQTV